LDDWLRAVTEGAFLLGCEVRFGVEGGALRRVAARLSRSVAPSADALVALATETLSRAAVLGATVR
jgi:hypothetical protein